MPRVFEPKVARVGPLGKRVKKKESSKRMLQKRTGSKSDLSHFPYASSSKAVEEELEVKTATNQLSVSKTKSFIGQDLLENSIRSSTKFRHTSNSNVVSKPSKSAKSATELVLENKNDNNINNVSDVLLPTKMLNVGRLALALDTRSLLVAGLEPRSVGDSVIPHYRDLIATMNARGVPPCLVAATCVDPTQKASISTTLDSGNTVKEVFVSGIGVKLHSLSNDTDKVSGMDMVSDVPCHLKQESSDSDTNGPFIIPKTVTSDLSWTIFRDLVDTIVAQTEKTARSDLYVAPLDIAILTTDVALFSDTNVDNHKKSVARFAKHVASHAQTRLVSSIQIVVAKTGQVDILALQNAEGRQEAYVSGIDAAHTAEMKLCVEAIQAVLDDIAFSSSGNYGANISLSVVDGTVVGYKYLSRHFIRESLVSSKLTARVRVDLPETADGTSCSVAFDASYSLLPFSLGTPQASMLLSDLDLMGKHVLNVVRRLPIISVDASLLFGVPMTVQTGFEHDMSQFQEMEALCLSLLRMLQEKEEALLLVTKQCDEPKKCGQGDYSGLFQGNQEQFFVLMAQELPGGRPPSTGLLFRIAHVDQLFAETLSTGKTGSVVQESDLAQYAYYVRESLNALDCRPYNPIMDEHASSNVAKAIILNNREGATPEHHGVANTVPNTAIEITPDLNAKFTGMDVDVTDNTTADVEMGDDLVDS